MADLVAVLHGVTENMLKSVASAMKEHHMSTEQCLKPMLVQMVELASETKAYGQAIIIETRSGKSNLKEVQANVHGMKSEMSAIRGDMHSYNDKLWKAVVNLSDKMASLTSRIDRIESKIDRIGEDLGARISRCA